MGLLKNAKWLGGIGAILMLVGLFVPVIGMILLIIGFILVFIAVKHVATETGDSSIFRNYLWFFVCAILAVVVAVGVMFAVIGAALFGVAGPMDPRAAVGLIWGAIAGIIAGLIVGYILLIVSVWFLKKSYTSIAERTKVNLFKTTGTIYFIGVILLIVFVGFIVIFIAKILEIVSFFSLPESVPGAPAAPPPETATPPPSST